VQEQKTDAEDGNKKEKPEPVGGDPCADIHVIDHAVPDHPVKAIHFCDCPVQRVKPCGNEQCGKKGIEKAPGIRMLPEKADMVPEPDQGKQNHNTYKAEKNQFRCLGKRQARQTPSIQIFNSHQS